MLAVRKNVLPIARLFAPVFVLAALLGGSSALATTPAAVAQRRLPNVIDDGSFVALPGSRSPRAQPADDIGAIPDATPLEGLTLVFGHTVAQQADLDALIAAQLDPASPLFHQWLTPAQFGARFGMSDADIASAQAWLVAHGFTLGAVSPSRTRISFSGTAGQFTQVFRAPLHNFRSDSPDGPVVNFAPSTEISLPAALASVVVGVQHASNFRPRSALVRRPAANFTSSQTGSHFLTPADVSTIYDVNPVYNAGYTGAGVSIAVIGQSAVLNTDIAAFQTAAGVPVRNPISVLVPGTGTSTLYTGDEAESDLDLEYTSGIAKNSTIYFVYTGSGNFGVFDSLTYAVQQDIAPIISISYGACEAGISRTDIAPVEQILQQAATQGQTVIVSSGDDGPTGCARATSLTTSQRQSLSTVYPASSAYAVAIGGTEFTPASVAIGNSTYFQATTGSDIIGSAISYIPEQAWNDDSATQLSASGGGASIFASRPAFQTGVPGIPSGTQRLVPDISLSSSPSEAGYLYCSSDSSTGVSGSCSHGFRDNNTASLTVAGGTSFAAPVFAGMLALINQAKGYTSTGQGQVDTVLYSLASNPSTYASAFHDITSGTTACINDTAICTSVNNSSFAATTGYDEATGLGSLDLNKLVAAWPAKSTALITTTSTLTAATSTPNVGAADTITLTVSGGATGQATIIINGGPQGVANGISQTVTLVAGSATYSFTGLTSGAYNVTSTYAGDATHSASNGTEIVINVAGTFTVAVNNVSVTHGSTVAVPVTVTPVSGYTGTVTFAATAPVALTNTCYSIGNVRLNGSAAATASLNINTGASTCINGTTTLSRGATGAVRRAANEIPTSPWKPGVIAIAGLLTAFGMRRRRKLFGVALAMLFSLTALTLSGCSGTGSPSTGTTGPTSSNTAPVGSYTVTVTGADTITGTLISTTTFTLTVN